MSANTDVAPDLYLFTIPEAGRRTSQSRTTIYAEIAAGRLKTVRIGSSRRITAAALAEYIDSLSA